MDICLTPLFYLILSLIVFVVEGQLGGNPNFLDLFDGAFMIPGGIGNVPTANFDDPNLPVPFLQFINSIPNNLEEVVPTRCQAPIEVGTCSGRSLRWAYDVEFRVCRPFFFSGCNGNQNNFPSRLSCERSCPTRCNQNIDLGFCGANLTRWGFNEFTGRCQAFNFGGCGGNTNSFLSERDCVETCGDVCLLPILRGPCDGLLPRWGFNFFTGQCQQFYYGGCQGNRNSYLSQEVCELACVRDAFPECPPIDPTLISVGPFGIGCNLGIPQIPCPPQGCQDGFACCENGCGSVCVQLDNPPPPSPCFQTIDVGTCNDEIPRFGFDAAMDTCQLFTYTGCGGNDNNFQTFSECIAACVPDFCNEPVERGPCPQNIIRWAYDSSTMTCTAFSYGGCGGNENNFVSPSQCFATCFRDLPQVDVCQQPISEGLCGGNVARFAFNIDFGFCLPLNYGGCGGNENNFATLLECDARCPPSIPASVCFLPLEVGPCLNFIQSWGFDTVAGECVQFNYGGCDGNGNRFLSQTACELRCLGQSQNLCPDGNPPCAVDPCTTATCPANPAALCTSDLCDVNRQCVAVFVNIAGIPVNCDLVIDPCQQAIVTGPCFLQIPRWGYNPVRNQCERFVFSGCLGNQNNFDSYAACSLQCIGVTNVNVCTQPIAVGTCTNFIASWGFNAQTGVCELFSYSGCEGNGNSFTSRAECITLCEPVNVCTLPVDAGPCAEQIVRFAFNPATGQCELFIYSGCLGNENNFATELECVQRCEQNTAPSIPVCPTVSPVTSFPGNNGNTVFWTIGACTDTQDGSITPVCNPTSGSFFFVGENPVTCTCTDTGGLSRQCTFNAVVEDITAPSTPVCPTVPPVTSFPGNSGNFVSWTIADCTDTQDGSITPVCNPVSGSFFDVGENPVTCTCTDFGGLSSQCTFNAVVVGDNTAPSTPVCPTVLPVTSFPGNVGSTVFWTIGACTDTQDVSITPVCDPVSGTFFDVGVNPVTCTCTDFGGLSSQCTFNAVVVGDNTAPSAPVCPTVPSVTSFPGNVGNVVSWTIEACTDTQDVSITPVCDPVSGSFFAVGENPVTCTCTDTGGLSSQCTFNAVVVGDNTAPSTPVCPTVLPVTSFPGNVGNVVSWTIEACTDTQDVSITPVCDPVSGTFFAVGENPVTCTCTDTGGLSSQCTFNAVVVGDNTAPSTPVCPTVAPVTSFPGNIGNFVIWTIEACTDTQDVSITPVCNPASGSFFAVGENPVTCTCTDTGGLSSQCTFNAVVGDNTAPSTPVCPTVPPVTSFPGNIGNFVIWTIETCTDTQDGSITPVCDPVSGSFFAVGENTVTCTCTDTNGLSSQCTFNAVVEDNTAPSTPVCPTVPSVTSLAGNVGNFVSWTIGACTDTQDGSITPECNPVSGVFFAVGENPVTCTCTDTDGLSSQCTFNAVVVEVNTAPSIPVCPTVPPVTSIPGNIGNTVSWTIEACTDTQDVSITPVCNPVSGTFFDVGENPVTCTCTDTGGLSTECSFNAVINPVETIGDDPCSQMIDSGPCFDNTIRFAYNPETTSCEVLVFGGCEGTSNNFLTMAECNQRCVTDVCAQPVVSCPGTESGFSYDPAQGVCVPVTIGGGCTANGNVFATQNECQQRCEVPVCSQTVLAGPCSASLTRFGFNSVTGQCQGYIYSGCGGTANRFNSLAECQLNCQADPCAQPRNQGPCSETQIRFGLNPITALCDTFTFGGCLGTDNLFLSAADCQLQCFEPVCSQAIDPGNCLLSLPRFAFNSQTGQCEPFTYSGCGGTGNRFYTLTDCLQTCQVDACDQPIDPGPCSVFIPRFGFNTMTGQCESFNYGGCLGNENLFETAAACLSRCIVDLCSLPLDGGPCTTNVGVWRFNSMTGLCETFTYGGCLGNPNRFTLQADCQARCEVNICSQPQDSGPCSSFLQSFSYNSVTNACEQFNYGGCLGGGNRFDTLALCQNTCLVDNTGEVCSKLVDPGLCSDGLTRFFYSSILGACQQFLYGGCGGTSNNFVSVEACAQRCVTDVCAQPLPNCPGALTRWGYNPTLGTCMSFTYDSCQDSGNLFVSQEACQQRCEVPVCSQARDVGVCTNQLPRFSFDIATGQCQPFDYTGCGGTANRFNTVQQCQDYCEVDICAQTVDPGPCSIPQLQFNFDPTTGQCDTFTYMGCLGSANRFETFSACQSRCQVDLCSLPLERGPCNGFSLLWGFSTANGVCEQFVYGGCLGNANRFGSQAACQARCEAPVCLQAEDPGPCSASISAFSYNSNTGTCGQFLYGGCLGGGNRFVSLTTCQATCEVPVGDPCSQIIDDGLCTDNIQRFAYNAQTLSCQTFAYTGCGGNSNNFIDEAACNQRCLVDVCAQPMASCAGTDTRWSYNPGEGTCQFSVRGDCRSLTGNDFETEAQCQQRCQVPICSQAIDTGTCTGLFTRFAFNTNTGQCQMLFYTGCGGTANHFNSLLDCEQHCEADVCARPQERGPCSPLLNRIAFDDNVGQCVPLTYGGCLGSSNRFTSLAECQARCQVDVCTLPLAVGSCAQATSMWWFNQDTGACEQFTYTGCEGNANRFASQTACMQRCIDEVCLQPLDVGVCEGALQRFRFNSLTGQCVEYTYSGCFGSSNSFTSSLDCQNRCTVDRCSLSQDPGPCIGTELSWGYISGTDTCEQFRYGGCLGNSNRFSLLSECLARCQVTNICNEVLDPGPCTAFSQQFYFNSATSQCENFQYGGCLGGNNRFSTQAACEATCQVGFAPSCPVPMQDGFMCGFVFCLADVNCGTGELCCSNGCAVGAQCTEAVFVDVKSGSCPAIPAEDPASCGDFLCQEDNDCGLLTTQKCCYTGCGTACMDPV